MKKSKHKKYIQCKSIQVITTFISTCGTGGDRRPVVILLLYSVSAETSFSRILSPLLPNAPASNKNVPLSNQCQIEKNSVCVKSYLDRCLTQM